MLLYVLYSTVYSELLYLYSSGSSSITCTYFMYNMYGVHFRQVLHFIIYYSILVLTSYTQVQYFSTVKNLYIYI